MTSNGLIDSFNALPRKPRAPLGRVPNEWHFDLRYVHIEPTPSHVLIIIHPQLQFIHVERLPFGIPNDCSGIAFFPESGKEAAPEVSKTLLHVFVNNIGRNDASGSQGSPAFAPWKLTTQDKTLAAAVGAEFKRLGVRAEELHRIGVSTTSSNRDAHLAFQTHFQSMESGAGIDEGVSPLVSTPGSIAFHNFDIAPPRPTLASLGMTEMGEESELALLYARRLSNSRPPQPSNQPAREGPAFAREQTYLIQEMVRRKPESVVKNLADRGDPEASFDYGMRLLIGLGCKYNRSLSRSYLVNALASPLASKELKSTVHSFLIDWYISASRKEVRNRYLFAAAHHANLAASLGRRVVALEFPASSEVLGFVKDKLEPFSKENPEVPLFYRDAWKASKLRAAHIAGATAKMELKRLRNPLRYRCASVGCGVEADKGKMLSQCAGKCDADKKPSYCSKECQKADWKDHRSFCIPGAPCSVIDTTPSFSETIPSKEGTIEVPVTNPDGTKVFARSSTVEVGELKELRDIAATMGLPLPFLSPSFRLEKA